jgi:hypothetical protein
LLLVNNNNALQILTAWVRLKGVKEMRKLWLGFGYLCFAAMTAGVVLIIAAGTSAYNDNAAADTEAKCIADGYKWEKAPWPIPGYFCNDGGRRAALAAMAARGEKPCDCECVQRFKVGRKMDRAYRDAMDPWKD